MGFSDISKNIDSVISATAVEPDTMLWTEPIEVPSDSMPEAPKQMPPMGPPPFGMPPFEMPEQPDGINTDEPEAGESDGTEDPYAGEDGQDEDGTDKEEPSGKWPINGFGGFTPGSHMPPPPPTMQPVIGERPDFELPGSNKGEAVNFEKLTADELAGYETVTDSLTSRRAALASAELNVDDSKQSGDLSLDASEDLF
jgi:hypothetical protein